MRASYWFQWTATSLVALVAGCSGPAPRPFEKTPRPLDLFSELRQAGAEAHRRCGFGWKTQIGRAATGPLAEAASRMATIRITTINSISVKPFLFFMFDSPYQKKLQFQLQLQFYYKHR